MKVISVLLSALLVFSLTGCLGFGPRDDDANQEKPSSEPTESNKPKDKDKDKDDDVIIAGTVDTSSDYSFDVEGAFVGMDEYSEEAVVILVCEFQNNSDETISYGSALDAVAFQSGYELETAYLKGASGYTYENIEPGKTIPVLIGWKLVSASDKVAITVTDRYHYAKEVIFEGEYTVDELIENSKKFVEEYSGIIDEDQNVTVSA